MKKLQDSKLLSFSALEPVLLMATLVVIVLIGYNVYSRQQTDLTVEETMQSQSQQLDEQSPTADDVSTAPEIQSDEDLNNAEAVLDNTDVEGSNEADGQVIENQTADF